MRALVSVGGRALPCPSEYSGNTATIVDSGRNVAGKFIGAVVRDDVAKIELSWKYLSVKQWAAINKLFKRSAGGKFINSVTFFDQSAGGWITRNMYVSDRNAGVPRVDVSSGAPIGWNNCKLSLIEA